MTDKNRWSKIPQFPQSRYEVDVPWQRIEENLTLLGEENGISLSPDYQRAHVWTMAQREAYIEYQLMGGEVGKNITWNAPGWMTTHPKTIELVDGKQRLESVRMFIRGEVEAFGMRFDATTERLPVMDHRFRFRVCVLPTRADVLDLYLNINAGGTPHAADELDRVRALRRKEES